MKQKEKLQVESPLISEMHGLIEDIRYLREIIQVWSDKLNE